MKILLIHDESLMSVRLAPMHRYRPYAINTLPTYVDENLFDRDLYELYQIPTSTDLTDMPSLGKLLKFIEKLELGKHYFVVVVNRFHRLFGINDGVPEGQVVERDFVTNALTQSMDLIRHHTKNHLLFAGFNTRALSKLRIETMDLLRRRNPSSLCDGIYYSDVMSASDSVTSSSHRLLRWDKSRLFLMRNLALSILRNKAIPYFDPPVDGSLPPPVVYAGNPSGDATGSSVGNVGQTISPPNRLNDHMGQVARLERAKFGSNNNFRRGRGGFGGNSGNNFGNNNRGHRGNYRGK
jgi:hypothetical protein